MTKPANIFSVVRAWLPVLVWLAIIAVESTDLLSSQHTGSLLYGLLSAMFGHIDREKFAIFHTLLRKLGHFVGYGILSVLFLRALRETVTTTMARSCALSVALTFVVASLDELHQSFLPSRTGRVHDVVLDTAAAVCLQVIVLMSIRRQQKAAAV